MSPYPCGFRKFVVKVFVAATLSLLLTTSPCCFLLLTLLRPNDLLVQMTQRHKEAEDKLKSTFDREARDLRVGVSLYLRSPSSP